MESVSRKNVVATLGVVILALLFTYSPIENRLAALSVDTLLMVRDMLFGQRYPADQSHVAVIALDEQTYHTEPFASLPKVLWTPQIAGVQDAVLASGAKVIGYDVIFPASLESHLKGYEKPFLRSLMQWGRQGGIVLGKVQHSDKPVAPHPSQRLVVQNNIHSLNMIVDIDDVIRRIPLFFTSDDGGKETSMALELAARSIGARPEIMVNGSVRLGGYKIPGSNENSALINFQGDGDIPTYSLADLHACAQAGKKDYFTENFRDKVVIIGGVLDVEDRKLTSKRFMTGQGAEHYAEPCVLKREESSIKFRRDTIPGVYILGSAVNDFLRQDFLKPVPDVYEIVLHLMLALVVSIITIRMRPAYSVIAISALMIVLFIGAIAMIYTNIFYPILSSITIAAISFILVMIFRYLVTDKQKNKIRGLFSLYLDSNLVDRMMDSDELPKLGGEVREVTIWFSDLANFTNISESLDAEELVRLMNRYFTVVTDIIEAHGGFVDKFIGDAVLAVFGAPIEDKYHAGHAVAAALMVREKLKQMNDNGEFGNVRVESRTGINTGDVVVGNVGSSRRFNYTVMGDAVNLASRLEGANKTTKTQILVSEEVAKHLPKSIILREVATIQVKGKNIPTKVFEPMTLSSWRTAKRRDGGKEVQTILDDISGPGNFEGISKLSIDFSLARQYYSSRQFDKTIEILEPYQDDPAAAVLIKNAEDKINNPPPEDWDAVELLTIK